MRRTASTPATPGCTGSTSPGPRGRELVLTPDHDGRLVADVVTEWARVHGQPYRLTLTGPAGGTWSTGTGGEEITLDAIEFCRIASGRARGEGLLAHEVPF